MKDKLISGLPPIIMGIFIVVAVHTFAHVCKQQEDGTWMPCHYAAQVATAMGLVMAVLGLASLCVQAATRKGLNVGVLLAGLLIVATPFDFFIGVCHSPMMNCQAVTKPTLIVSGIVVIAVSAFAIYRDGKLAQRA